MCEASRRSGMVVFGGCTYVGLEFRGHRCYAMQCGQCCVACWSAWNVGHVNLWSHQILTLFCTWILSLPRNKHDLSLASTPRGNFTSIRPRHSSLCARSRRTGTETSPPLRKLPPRRADSTSPSLGLRVFRFPMKCCARDHESGADRLDGVRDIMQGIDLCPGYRVR